MRPSLLDREIFGLAVPALGALAAEPLYLLVDTAIVGHLGTPQLAALAVAATVLTTLVSLCLFLTYGTTAQVARLHGAGRGEAAGGLGVQALWLATAIGAALALVCAVFAAPLVALLGGDEVIGDLAERYLRLSALGLPCALIALAGQGFLRGVGDLRTPLLIVVAAQAANVGLEAAVRPRLRMGPGRVGGRHRPGAARHGRGLRARDRARPGPAASGAHAPAAAHLR